MLTFATLNDNDHIEGHQLRAKYEFFLGGHDLEILTIRQLIQSVGNIPINDRTLGWGAKTSDYLAEISSCQAAGRVPVLVELRDDLGLVAAEKAKLVVIIDHHDERAGRDVPTSLEQVFALLDLPLEQWSRQMALVAANDRGYVTGMKAIGATTQEIRQIRDADRAAQGITAEQEQIGRLSAEAAESSHGGRLKIVRLPHDRAATVTDALVPELGGAGFENLLIFCPSQTLFFGSGWCITHLKSSYPGGWSGGELPDTGFWGIAKALEERPLRELLEMMMTTKPASEIAVQAYKHIVMLPLLLRGNPNSSIDPQTSWLQPWVDEFVDKGWVDKTPGRYIQGELPGQVVVAPIPDEFSYEQMVYFHPFVRDFLFGDGQAQRQHRPVRYLTCDKVSAVEVELGKWQPENVRLRLRVSRTELYLMKPCVAILMVEVCEPELLNSDKPITLDILQDFQDQFRRLYPPFWWDESTKQHDATEAGLCLRSLKWLDADGAEIGHREGALRLSTPKSQFDEFARVGAEPPLFEHWRWFFGNRIEPLSFQPLTDKNSPPRIQQLLDERMAVMSYFGVEKPEEVSLGDHDRLTFVDASGTDAFPYQEKFLADRRSRHTYERFAHYGTRYFCSGYGFAMIGPVKNYEYGTVLPKHFSHHYFCLALIAQYQRAALLYFAEEMSSTVKDLGGLSTSDELSSAEYRKHIEKIQHRFLKFRSRAFFPEVTNQLQGRELFQMWFDVLETQKLFDLVDSTSERLTSAHAERESRQLSRMAARSIPWAVGLSVASLMLSTTQFWSWKNWSGRADWNFWIAIVVSGFTVAIMPKVLNYRNGSENDS